MTIELAYLRGPDALGCPEEQMLHDALLVRMGRDPIVASAPTRVTVTLQRDGDSFQGTMEQRDAAGELVWTHAPFRNRSCARLVELIGFSISSQIAPPVLPSPLPPPAPPEAPKPPPPPLPAARPPSDPLVIRAGAGTGVVLGAAPAPALSFAIDVGVRWRPLSISAEARATLPAGIAVGSGTRVSASLITASLLPCFHKSVVFGCALLQAGSLHASSTGADHPLSNDTLYLAAGARLGVEIPLLRWLAARVTGDLVGTLRPITLAFDERAVWTTPVVAGALGGGILGLF